MSEIDDFVELTRGVLADFEAARRERMWWELEALRDVDARMAKASSEEMTRLIFCRDYATALLERKKNFMDPNCKVSEA